MEQNKHVSALLISQCGHNTCELMGRREMTWQSCESSKRLFLGEKVVLVSGWSPSSH